MNCQTMYLWHGNLLLNFTPEKFVAFKKAITSLKYEDCCFSFPDQENRAVINTPHADICLTFSLKEWKNLIELMNEALFLKEVYSLMQG